MRSKEQEKEMTGKDGGIYARATWECYPKINRGSSTICPDKGRCRSCADAKLYDAEHEAPKSDIPYTLAEKIEMLFG